MNNKNATPKRVIYTIPSFPCRCEVLGDELCNDLVVIRCVDESSGADARVSMNVFDAKLLSDDILSGELDSAASFAFSSPYDTYGVDDFREVFSHFTGGNESEDYALENIVSRQLHLSATCAGLWKLEVLAGKGVSDESGNVYLCGMPTTYASTVTAKEMLSKPLYIRTKARPCLCATRIAPKS